MIKQERPISDIFAFYNEPLTPLAAALQIANSYQNTHGQPIPLDLLISTTGYSSYDLNILVQSGLLIIENDIYDPSNLPQTARPKP